MSDIDSAVWDVHHHWVNEPGYIDRLLAEMDRLNIERLGMIAMGDFVPDLFLRHGPQQRAADNDSLGKLIREHGDRFWGWGFIRLGQRDIKQDVEDVDRLADLGLAGLKFHAPLRPYDHPDYFPVFARAEQLGLPCLFHTGLFYPPTPLPGQGIRSENYRPIHVEPLAHEFPQLKIIMAHMGVCWNDEAAAMCRICPNVHADLSGRVDGWRSSRPIEWFRQLLYWPTAHEKVMFGSDVHADEIESTLADHRRIFEGLGWTPEQIQCAMRDNARRVLGIGD